MIFDRSENMAIRMGGNKKNHKKTRKNILLDFSLTVKAATLIFIYGRGSAVSSAKEGKSGFTYNLVKS